MSDLVGNPEDWFSHDAAQMVTGIYQNWEDKSDQLFSKSKYCRLRLEESNSSSKMFHNHEILSILLLL